MRTLPPALVADVQGGATTLATLWRIERRDGRTFGFTDHDKALFVDGLAHEAQTGLSAGAIEKSIGLAVDSAATAGVLDSAVLDPQEIADGLWDGARVDVWRVDWTDVAQKVHVFAGRLGEARRGASAFEAELRGLQAPLNIGIGRVFSKSCDADVGDARCGVDLTNAAFRGAGAVAAIIDARTFTASGLSAFADDWFSQGVLLWSSGGQTEVARHRQSTGSAYIQMLDARTLTVGEAFEITAGCDKRFATCQAKFANAANFRGFPHMPGNDAVQRGPDKAGGNDGGSRYA